MRVLITGGTGSLGQALTRICLDRGDVVCVFSRSESRQHEFAQALGPHDHVRFFLGDVRDRDRLVEVMGGCDAVIHTAALKRVDAIAYNPSEVRKTNIDGSANVTAAAVAAHVPRVLMISSDKAVEPTNDYGVSKAQMEHEAIASNAYTWPRGTRVACTRWGNVIGSTGSVIHVFRRAVALGLPLPITDPDCTRFWLTVEHAAAFTLAALEVLEGGEIFVPILPSMRLGDLAEAVAPGWPVGAMGLRPGGEKRHELLINHDEAQRSVAAPSFGWLIKPAMMFWRGDCPWPEAPFPPGAIYRSDVNEWTLTIPEMRKLLEAAP